MLPGKKISIIALYLFVISFFCVPVFATKSLYVINDTQTSHLYTYEVNGNSLIYQIDYVCELDPPNEAGAVAITIDESEYGQFLFVTFESSDEVELIDAKTMQHVDKVIAPGATNLAGVAMDIGKRKLYAVDRYTNNLYSWSWDQISKRLTPDFGDPYYIDLEGLSSLPDKGAFGIALDEEYNRLYVADNTNKIKYYNTTNWSDPQPLLGQINASCNVISVAIDVPNQLLYYGSMGRYGQGDTHLYKYNISTQTTSSVVIGTSVSVAGIAVDQDTSLVYITTFGGQDDVIYPNPPQDRLMIYNSNLVKQSFESGDIGNPAGVTVATNVGYKEPLFSITKDNNDVLNNCVRPDDYVTFNITWDANDTSDTNVFVIDYLPYDLEYYSSEPTGDYNSTYNTVKWLLPDFNENSFGTFEVTAKVKQLSCPCGRLTNIAMLEGDNYCSPAQIDVNACSWSEGIVYVDIDETEGLKNGTDWDNAYTVLQDALEAAKDCEGSNAVWVAEGSYQPTENPSQTGASFKLIDSIGLYGHFGGTETSLNQREFSNDVNETILNGQIGQQEYENVNTIIQAEGINDSVVDGFTIQSAYEDGIYIKDSNVVIANCKFDGNDHKWEGVIGVYISGSSADLYGCEFKNHYESILSSISTLTIQGCSFDSDIGGSYSGSIHIGGSATISNSTISNCLSGYGIYSIDIDLEIDRCIISNNSLGGLYLYQQSQKSWTLKDSIIRYNGNGITLQSYGQSMNAILINNWIHDNSYSGIYILNPQGVLTIRNNTIYKNSSYGISGGSGNIPEVRNCIIRSNTGGDFSGTFSNVNYCCLQSAHSGNCNITDDPDFMNPSDPNDLHISFNSPCKNAGDSNGIDSDETDIDGEGRIKYGAVDIGADEYYKSPDFDKSGKVDFKDFAILAVAWRTLSGGANYNKECDLKDDNKIDCADLELFCLDWLWMSPWEYYSTYGGEGEGHKMAMGTGEVAAAEVSAESSALKEQAEISITADGVKEILEWTDSIWPEIKASDLVTEGEFLDFRSAVEQDLLKLLEDSKD